MENKADIALEAKIENADFDESTLIEIRVPLNAPYLSNNSTDFERYDGELELDGVHYKYVKRKIVNDELVLLCLPNKSKTELQNSRNEFFKLVNDLNHTQSKEKSNTSTFSSLTIEYKKEMNAWTLEPFPVASLKHASGTHVYVASGYDIIPEHPPKA
ncbi:MAG: hypothetical protein JNK79_05775 [Chitinophagaceae bacterium]|nr:hypothetical protein [Chitinophagaceae bacterium]